MRARADYRTTLKPVWCAGCGNFGLLNALTKRVLPEIGIPNYQTLIISGIGCSSRIPAYIDTYGFNSIHGRALVIAQGAKLAKPELTVVAVGGDGDFFSIGAGHLPHAVRRNIDITCIMVNNFVYALTKGQISPTTPHLLRGEGPFLSLEQYPPVDPLLDMISYSLSTRASFIAQGITTDIPHLEWLIKEGIEHKGFSYISVFSHCVTFNPPELFSTIRANARYLQEGELVELPASSREKPWRHDLSDISRALQLAQISLLDEPLLGIFFRGKEVY
ncbi:MAG TPA: 2-oxoacid:ferredoxin oxidoreductase subunit beta [Dehalococcoidia bacterium]|nr:2-oxoacid:ferredoxin oxidoreductase subunit beta [Dehalococcoidia bacterium]